MRQVGYLQELYRDAARSAKHKIPATCTEPHTLRPRVLQCPVYHENIQALPVGKQALNYLVHVDKSEMN